MKSVIWFDNEEVWSSSMLDIMRLGVELEIWSLRLDLLFELTMVYSVFRIEKLRRFFDDVGDSIFERCES